MTRAHRLCATAAIFAAIGALPMASLAGTPIENSLALSTWGSFGGPTPFSEWEIFRGVSKEVTASNVVVFDPDGPGPEPELIIAYGRFTETPEVTSPGIMGFDGVSWIPIPAMDALPPNVPATIPHILVEHVCKFDIDGDGPQPSWLALSGTADRGNHGVGLWRPGEAAVSLSDWNTSDIGYGHLTQWNPQGGIATPRSLVISGELASISGVPRNDISDWNGASWGPFGGGLCCPAGLNAETVAWDPDGPGSGGDVVVLYGVNPTQLTLAGQLVSVPVAWNGAAATHLDMGVVNSSFASDRSMVVIKPDGDLGPSWLVGAGAMKPASAPSQTYMLVINDAGVKSFVAPGSMTPRRVLWWDADDDGPADGRFLVLGTLNPQGAPSLGYVVAAIGLDGSIEVLRSLVTNEVHDIVVRREPAPTGPGTVQTIYGIWFDVPGRSPDNPGTGMFRVTDSGFQLMHEPWGFNDVFEYPVYFDADGDGPEPPATYVTKVSSWNGVDSAHFNAFMRQTDDGWEPFDLGPSVFTTSSLQGAAVIDWDNGGPNPPQLIRGQGSKLYRVVADQQWIEIPGSDAGVTVQRKPITWDADGAGPGAPVLVFQGSVGSSGWVRIFDGSSWTVSATFTGTLRGFDVVDVDGPGPSPTEVVVWGSFSVWNGAGVGSNVMTFDGVRWLDRSGPSWISDASQVRLAVLRGQDASGRPYDRLLSWVILNSTPQIGMYISDGVDAGHWASTQLTVPGDFLNGAISVDVNGSCHGGEGLVGTVSTGIAVPETESDFSMDIVWCDPLGQTLTLFHDIPGCSLAGAHPSPESDATRLFVSFNGTELMGHRGMGLVYVDLPDVECVGDVLCDGLTNAADFAMVAASFGQGPGLFRYHGDLNGDGYVNVDDFIILANDFGCPAP